ncbi:hypothetical protein BD626DRAFT_621753 [Schizophyllum amplum]|uniref:Uncharacterized protein n=1 Tax=Schizophyllum amplum TaxID=97359 RepID=A0A550CF40_9AGAR|nr:hypothetical protein BD626DRAFT_621753 [Auriculariopsis ampla]
MHDKEQKSAYQKQIHALKAQQSRVAARLGTAVKRALRIFGGKVREENGAKTFHLKEKGVIPDVARDVVTDLVALHSVPANAVIGAFKRIASALGVPVEGDVSDRSVNRIMLEGGAASEAQFVSTIREAEGVTISSDGTTHKNINLESRHATVIDKDGNIQEFFLGIEQAVNHTSETQFTGWTDLIEDLFEVGNEFCADGERAEQWRVFWNKLTGMMSDHAEDQKKLFRLLRDFKQRCERELRGERWHFGENGLLASMTVISERMIQDVGGTEAWQQLTEDERTKRYEEGRSAYFHKIGEADFDKLPAEAKVDVDFMLWAGCCMHKEMNAFKGFCTGMEGWWKAKGKDGPIKLYNRDNHATVQTAQGTTAAQRAEDRTKGGAVKLVSLAGAIFRHKDRKRGQQDTLRFFFDAELGFTINFPDTSNTRFQSHADACTVLITYLDLLIKFLEYVRDNKGTGKLNHMEQNVLDGFRCRRTMREVVLVVLYAQAISAPYMREIRGPFRSFDSVLEQGPLHAKVIAHLEKIAADPGLLVNDRVEFETASLDGKLWHDPEAIYAALAWIQRCSAEEREEMKDQLTMACKAATETWRRFSSEFQEISKASKENLRRAPMANTNDANEAAFGRERRALRNMPSISHPQLNSRQMFRHNKTSKFLRNMNALNRIKLRKLVRKRDGSGANRAKREKLMKNFKKVAVTRRKKNALQQEKKDQATAKINNTIVISDVTALDEARDAAPRTEKYLTVLQLDEQLNWYQHHFPDGPLPKTKKARGDRMQKFTYLRQAILHRNSQMEVEDVIDSPGEPSPANAMVVDMDDDDEMATDSEADFYRGA